MDDLVSVVIPCYNQGKFIEDAIDSVLNQSYANYEIIIINDGSNDDSLSFINKATQKYNTDKIKAFSKDNEGVAVARNVGIALSSGKYILPLDSDDRIHPDFLRKTTALLQNDPSISIAYTDYLHFGDVELLVATEDYNFKKLYQQKCLFTATALYRKQAWIDAGGYKRNMIWGAEDWDFWISCGRFGHFGKRIPEPLFYYRTRLSEHSRLKTANLHSEILFSRSILNNASLYDDSHRKWASSTWATTLKNILSSDPIAKFQFDYLLNLSCEDLVADAETLLSNNLSKYAELLYLKWIDITNSDVKYAAHFNLGCIYFQSGELTKADQSFRNSLKLKNDFLPALESLKIIQST